MEKYKMFKVVWHEIYEALIIAKTEEEAEEKAMNMDLIPKDIPSNLMTIEEVKNVNENKPRSV